MNGALLINKSEGISSFGVIEHLQKQWLEENPRTHRKHRPKLGHGGTLDPFATGMLIVLCGKAVKLARYFLGATKYYEGLIHFGQTTIPGDPTDPISETSPNLPASLEQLQELAKKLTLQPYQQIPPMHSAKKLNGKPLYELARAGLDVEREPKTCYLYEFLIQEYSAPNAKFGLKCSSGTYVRTLAQDFARMLNTVGMLDSLHRTSCGVFPIEKAMTLDQILQAGKNGESWDELPCWIPFDRLLDGYSRAEASSMEKEALNRGQQNVLFNILKRMESPTERSSERDDCVAIFCDNSLIAVARRDENIWGIERVFSSAAQN